MNQFRGHKPNTCIIRQMFSCIVFSPVFSYIPAASALTHAFLGAIVQGEIVLDSLSIYKTIDCILYLKTRFRLDNESLARKELLVPTYRNDKCYGINGFNASL